CEFPPGGRQHELPPVDRFLRSGSKPTGQFEQPGQQHPTNETPSVRPDDQRLMWNEKTGVSECLAQSVPTALSRRQIPASRCCPQKIGSFATSKGFPRYH